MYLGRGLKGKGLCRILHKHENLSSDPYTCIQCQVHAYETTHTRMRAQTNTHTYNMHAQIQGCFLKYYHT